LRSYSKAENPWVAIWLSVMVFLVVSMIVFGGATRLTNSGLSITEWLPITGAIPPLSEAQWISEFDKYKQISEFLAEHPDMDLSGFKFIYFMEWGHRQLGRIIGLAFALPYFYLLITRALPAGRTWRFFIILLLIGIQGAIGWWMVYSGLKDDRVSVSQYRLATHLGMAFIILAALYWSRQDARQKWPSRTRKISFKTRSTILSAMIFLQIISGAFVSGTGAGKTYNSWPLMDGSFFPDGYFQLAPLWKNMFENIAAIQFNHRFLAYIILIMAVWVFISTHGRNLLVNKRSRALLFILIFQAGLGIVTLLSVAPLYLALMHQFIAIFVFLSALSLARAAWVQT